MMMTNNRKVSYSLLGVFAIVLALAVFVGPLAVFAQTDDTDNTQDQLKDTLTWAEVRITTDSPPVYIPARCVAGVSYADAVVWTGTRGESLSRASEDLDADDNALEQAQQSASIQQSNVTTDLPNLEQQLATITCTVPIFAAPGGELVENEQLVAGQTWFVTPLLFLHRTGQTVQSQSTVPARLEATVEATPEATP